MVATVSNNLLTWNTVKKIPIIQIGLAGFVAPALPTLARSILGKSIGIYRLSYLQGAVLFSTAEITRRLTSLIIKN